MSSQPVRPRSRELEIVRVLFDKHLLERAVNLAEARWDGSGEMVRLAYHWQDLSPADRRAQLEKMGPEQLARFRPLAELDADLASVLDSLEQRGVLPPALVADPEDEPADPYIDVPAPAPGVASEPAGQAAEVMAPDPADAGGSILPEVLPKAAEAEPFVAGLSGMTIDREEVRRTEQERRADAMRSGEELLQRVRARLDTTARRVTNNPIGSGHSSPALPATRPMSMPGQATGSSVTVSNDEQAFVPPSDYWLKKLREEQVVVVDPGTVPPTDDEMVALANELGLSFHEFNMDTGAVRDLFGGLARSGASVKVRPGPLARAVAEPSLTVIRGRLFPRMESRMRQGMLDIPGTKATVKLAGDARVLVIS